LKKFFDEISFITKKILISFLTIFTKKRKIPTFPIKKPNSIAIIAQERIGDSILLTPLIFNLRKNISDLKIVLITLSPDSYNFFKNDKNIDKIFFVKANYIKYFQEIRKFHFDILFNTKDHPSFTFIYQTLLIKADIKIGIKHQFHEKFYDYLLFFPYFEHIVRKNCGILSLFDIATNDEICRPYIPQNEISDEIRSILPEISKEKIVGINLSAGEKSRELSLEQLNELIPKLKCQIILFSMPSRSVEKEILENKHQNILKTPKTKSFSDVVELIKNIDILISPDTSLIHVASSFNKKIVGIYRNNPIHHKRFYPFVTNFKQIISKTDFLKDVIIDEVYEAVSELISIE